MDRFDIPAKGTNLEALERWRKGVFVLNAARRFRHTLNVQKIREAQDRRNFKVALLVTRAAILFMGSRFKVAPEILECLPNNPDLYKKLGGLEGICTKLDVSDMEYGITGNDADIMDRKQAFGENKHDEKSARSLWVFIWEAFHDLTLIVLVICAVVSLVVGILTEGITSGWYDGIGILASVLIVVFVTAISDYRQALQFQQLEREKKKVKVSVIRDGSRLGIYNHDVVVGDIIVLSTGDQVTADGIFITGNSCTIDESSLTGESEPVHPSIDKPFLLSGTMVQSGDGRMLVTAVGMRTEWGKLMAQLSEGGSRETPLQVRLNGVATVVGKIGLLFAVTTFFVLIARFLIERFMEGFDNWKSEYLLEILDYFATSVTILVVAVPEGLPLAVTLSLAYAMKQMMKDNALVRNLSACETMGSATCICSDKTGTLTTNHMTVVKVCSSGFVEEAHNIASKLSEETKRLWFEAIFMNTSGEISERDGHHEVLGSPTETAILELGLAFGGQFKKVRSSVHIVQTEPFSSQTKSMLTLVKLENGRFRSHCKGASEIVLNMCDHKVDKDKTIVPLGSEEKHKLEETIKIFARDALRTLCFAFIDLDAAPGSDEELPKAGLTFLGIVGIKDPVRPGVKEAVQTCLRAGIKVRMVTGDNIETASAIARECNILTDKGFAVEGVSFRQWSPTEMMEKVQQVQVIARSSPSDKLKLVEYLKNQNEVVSVTGDGTNDAPALHESDIGLAMGITGTEVAKSSADIVILDDNFTTIVNVAMWGRSVYVNIQKFVQFQLTVNLVALTINFVSACIVGKAPLTAVQLLWVNLIMDTLGALALATERPYKALMERPPVGRKGNLITNIMWRNIVGQAVFQLIVLWVLQYCGKALLHLNGTDADVTLDTMMFNTFVFLQVFNEINSRDMEKLNVFSTIFTNKVFVSVLLFTVVVQVVIVEFLGMFADTTPLSPLHWGISVAIGFCSIFVGFVLKTIPVPSKPFTEYLPWGKARRQNDEYQPLPSTLSN